MGKKIEVDKKDPRLTRLVVDLMARHNYCTLATCANSSPHAAVVLYASDGLDIYFFTGTRSKKIKNIKENPNVAVTIEGKKLLFFPQAVEIQGRAKILSKDDEKAQKVYYSKWKIENKMAAWRIHGTLDALWVKISPEKIFTYGIGTRLWDIDPKKQLRRAM